jgi:2-methylcitrate dehydratase PrpD
MLRVGEALGPAHYRIFHNTATAGPFGSAAAAATLLNLAEDQWVWAFGNAGTQAAGLWEFNADAAMSKHLHAGHAAQAGVRAALLAREGFTGAERILEGEKGFFSGLCPDARPERVLAPAPGWKLPETSIKPYPSCRHTHPAIDAALDLRAGLDGADPRSVTELLIESYPAALALTDNPAPTSPYAAKFSIQFCVASALAHGRPGLSSFEGERLQDPTVMTLLQRVKVHVAEDLARAYPTLWGARITACVGGTSTVAERTTAKGDPEDPLSDGELEAKARDLFEYAGLSGERRDRARGMVANLDGHRQCPDVVGVLVAR